MNPRKTEYRGIVFGSKSEARFALFLDDQQKSWWYQPDTLRLDDGYVPDFLLASIDPIEFDYEDDCHKTNATLTLAVIEYKPRKPTQTYLSELADRFAEIGDRLHGEKTLDMMADCVVNSYFVVMVGGMGYEKAEHLYFSWGPPGRVDQGRLWYSSWGHLFDGVDPDVENKRLSNYRFDLEPVTA